MEFVTEWYDSRKEGGRTMTMREEAKAAAVTALRERGWNMAADSAEEERGEDAYYASTATNAMLDVIDQYEEVRVRPWVDGSTHCLVLPEDVWFGQKRKTLGPPFTMLRRKQESKPDLPELARRAVKAWREPRHDIYEDAMTDLADALDE